MIDEVPVFDANVAQEVFVKAREALGRSTIFLPFAIRAHESVALSDQSVDFLGNVHAEGEFKVPSGVVVSCHVFSFLGWGAPCPLLNDSTNGNMRSSKTKEKCYFLDSAMHFVHSVEPF